MTNKNTTWKNSQNVVRNYRTATSVIPCGMSFDIKHVLHTSGKT